MARLAGRAPRPGRARSGRLTIKAGTPPPAEQLARAEAEADVLFGIVDAALEASRFIAGSAFTLADIPIGIAVRRWTTLPVKRAPLAALGQWFDEVRRRPGARSCQADGSPST
jgi:glutathione S-transferase